LKKKKKSHPHKPDRLDIRPFNGDADDMQRFVLDVESKFDYHRKALHKDMDKIRLIVPLLEGKAKKWYENIHVNINKHAAARQNVPFDKNSIYRKWETFFALLQSSFGGSLTRDRSVLEWNRLRHRDGHIDDFLDRIIALTYATGYSGDMVLDKVKEGLTDEMRRNWAMVQNKPTRVPEYLASLRAYAHEIEQTATYTRSQHRSRGSGETTEQNPKAKGKGEKREKREKRAKKEKPAQSQSQSGPAKKGKSGDFKDKETELKGIPESIREERRKASMCLKCGKPNHTWFKCYTPNPVTHSVASVTKKSKRKRDKEDDTPAPKKAKVERLGASMAVVSETKPEVKRSPSPRIFEIEESSDAMSIY